MEPQIRLLGANAIHDAGGAPLRLPTRKCCALLAYLALSGGRDIPREELAALLWPRGNDEQARASLRQELAVLRKVMAAAGLAKIDSTKEMVRLALPVEAVDTRLVGRLVKVGTIEALRRAVGLYRGEFLSGLNVAAHPFEDWLWVERLRLKALVQNAYLHLLDLESAGPDAEAAIATATALLAVEPTQEQGHRALMRLYRRTGRRAEALQQFQRCAEVLRRDLDTDPSQETTALAERIRADLAGPRTNGRLQRAGAAQAHVEALMMAPDRAETHKVIVMVASLAGLVALGPRIDPQDLAQLQDRLLQRCGRVVAALGGNLLPGAGGKVIACFGYPDRSPADVNRALQAAQSIAREPVALSAALEVWPRTAVARGSVLIRADPTGLETADLIGLPLQQAFDFVQVARGGEVVISSEVRASIGAAIQTTEVSPARYGDTAAADRGHVLHDTSMS